jgi:CrcB protein
MQAITLDSMLVVGLGGALGALLRFCITLLVNTLRMRQHNKRYDSAHAFLFPWHTLIANLLGSALMGGCGVLLVHDSPHVNTLWGAMILIGFLGGLTTFSSYILDTLVLFRDRQWRMAICYALLTPGLCLTLDAISRIVAATQ